MSAFVGPLGNAWKIDLSALKDDWRSASAMDMYLVHIPSAHPLWPSYWLTGVHLRDVPGQDKPPHKQFQNASHELLLVALNPECGPYTQENMVDKIKAGGHWLTPVNMVQQTEDLTDEQFNTLLLDVLKALLYGLLPAEPDDYIGSHDRWAECVRQTALHVKTQGLSCFTSEVKQ
jgi:hypothetical protein